jgi:S-DNA-T family DNA segregation ATPase FtsK/SpoIIIE
VSSNLAAGRALETVERLKSTVEEFAARADKLNEEHQSRVLNEQRRCEIAVEEQNQQLAGAAAEADATLQAIRSSSQQTHARRKAWIGKAYQAAKEQALKKIEDTVGGCKYELQKKMLQAERDREHGSAAAHTSFDEFRRDLAAEQQRLAGLEHAAQGTFGGYRTLQRLFLRAYEKPEGDLPQNETQTLAEFRASLAKAETDLARFRVNVFVGLFRYFPAWLLIVLAVCALGLPAILIRAGINSFSYQAGAFTAGALVLLLVVRFAARRQVRPLALAISGGLARARRLHDASLALSEAHSHQEMERLKAEFQNVTQLAEQRLKSAQAEAAEQRVSCRMETDERTVRIQTKNEHLYRARLERLEHEYGDARLRLKRAAEVRIKSLTDARDQKMKKFTDDYEITWRALEDDWKSRTGPLYAQLDLLGTQVEKLFPSWDARDWHQWTPPQEFAGAAKFAELKIQLAKLCAALPKDPRLALPGPARLSVPLCLAYPEQGSLLVETDQTGHDEAISALNNTILRLLSVAPPGRLNFTVIDPVGLGQNFAGIMHLADYEEQIINSRIWTQSTQIEEKLADLNEHMEKVIQMYLRNEYQSIAEYNEQAGVIAEKYYFLVVADFPANFTDVAAKRLLSIAASGPRCGVYTLIHWDHRQPLPQDFIPDELRKTSVCLSVKGGQLVLTGKSRLGADLVLDQPPSPEKAIEFVQLVGRLSRDSSRVEVPFSHVVPDESEIWSEETSSELRVPIGRTGATKLQYLAIGKGTRQHGLIAGKTGSGKSTLFHVIITNLALWCSPEQVEFYLVDFKKGVEFKCYASQRLPHARVVAIESDREFGLSVLQRVDDELKRRGDLFRQLGVQDVAGYKRAGGSEPIPRTLLLIDEFQEFFVEDDKVSQTASLLLDRIVRQGRAFGIHVLLGSQTLGGAYTVARTTLGQMVIRIALQCNEADAYLIMDDTNPAPRLLSRPGEGIYNDMAGALEGNSPFQAVWLPEDVRDSYLSKVRARAYQHGKDYPGPLVFEGNSPADARENALLRTLLEAETLRQTSAGRMWFGAPNSIKGPTEAVFQRQSGNNLILVGQRDDAVLAMLALGLVSLAAQYPIGAAQFILCDASPPGTPARDYLERVVSVIPHPVKLAKQSDLPAIMKDLSNEMKRRTEDVTADAAPPVYLFIHGLQRFNKLRFEEEFGFSSADAEKEPNPAAMLNELVSEGPRLGFHVVATCDSYNNVTRFLSRKALSEFEMRILFQMSANDSASLIDNPKAGALGLHRALFYNAQEGYLETFRPYSLPGNEWLEQTKANLRRLLRDKPVNAGVGSVGQE